ncbi:MAG: hypothetical protein VST72_01000 [Nitrospirota bacterium]|nr:hypothetical protein [Nitrospirota bacterium]
MALSWPYDHDKFTAYPGDTLSTNLTLAVWVVDDFTLCGPLGPIRVVIKEGDIKAFRNLGGYYLFTDMAAGNYTVAIESDLYYSREKIVDTSLLDPKNPVLPVVIKPKTAYPFPAYATLVRGIVMNADPVAGAEVKVSGKPNETVTDDRGEFVLYFKGIRKEDITIEIKKDGNTKNVNITVEEGKAVSTGIIVFP